MQVNGKQPLSFEQLNRVAQLVNNEQPIFKSTEEQPGANDPQDVIVLKAGDDLLKGDTPPAAFADEVETALKGKGVQVDDKFSVVPGVEAHADAATIKQLKDEGYQVFSNKRRNLLPDVPGHSRRFADAGDDHKWDMPKVDAPKLLGSDKVNGQGVTGKGVNVAVIDSGFQRPNVPLVAWEDVVDGSETPIDPVGHGTHCAGDIRQTAPDAGIVAIRVMNEEGQGRPSDIIRGIQFAIEHQKDMNIGVINMSLGGPNEGVSSKDDPIDKAVEQAIRKGIVVVDAAGNDGPNPETIGSPADDPKGIAVGSALNPTTVSDFSSRGPTPDGVAKPDVTAPGEFIVSWNVPGSQLDKITTVVEKIRHMDDAQLVKLFKSKPQLIEAFGLPEDVLSRPDRDDVIKSKLPPMYKPDEDHLAGPGTSFASPLVAGVVADMEQANPSATPASIKDALRSTASPMDGQFGPNDQGAGFVNAPGAVSKIAK